MTDPLRIRLLGWAGVELSAGHARIAVDPYADPGPFTPFLTAPAGELLREPAGGLIGALVTHLHRDHTDPRTLAKALAPGAPVLAPPFAAGPGHEGVERMEQQLAASDLNVIRVAPGETRELGPFSVTAVEAVDGMGDPQVSWVIEAGGTRVFHGGDTLWHGAWWRLARTHGPFAAAFLPANGAAIAFPWLDPPADLPATMTPEQAVAAARALRAEQLIAIHHDGLSDERFYRPVTDVPQRLAAAANGYPARAGRPGEEVAL
jgi:L-ascorbate metabolism protein UlaG (beta-lactamase superfamily)